MPKQPKDVRIEQILSAALDEFVEHGFDGATVEAVARRAGITKGGIYHHFRSKDEILVALNRQYGSQMSKFQVLAMANPSARDGLAGYLRDYIHFWADHPRETVFIFLSLAKLLAVKEYWLALREHYAASQCFFVTLLERAVAQTELKPHNSEARAVAIMAAMDGISPLLVAGNGTADTVIGQLESALLGDLILPQPSPYSEIHNAK